MWTLGGGSAQDVAENIGLTVRRSGGGVLWALRDDPTGGFFCRAVGLGIHEPLTADVLDALVAAASEAGAPVVCLQPSPRVLTPEVTELLAAHDFAVGRTWEKLLRDTSEPPQADTDLRIEVVGPEHAEEYATVTRAAFGMPDLLQPLVAVQTRTPGWTTYGAFDGDTLVGAAALFVDGATGALSGAATLPSHRGRGAQRALMSRRLADAAEAGCRWVATETGSETPDEPNPSLHNMHWAGFTTLYRRTNWIRRFG
jgi:GNAT superfamily N-acetyltransferase